jgi:flagellar protein FliO/FliZ
MLTPVVFLPLAAVLIHDVKAESTNGALTVEIATSDPVATSDVRVASGGSHRMYVYLDSSAARQPSFGDGSEAVVAHQRARYTKLEVPTRVRCGEPFGVVATEGGVRIRATCKDGAAMAGSAPLPVQVQATVNLERPLPDAPRVALVPSKQASASLRAALALPLEAPVDEAKGEARTGEASAGGKAGREPVGKAVEKEHGKPAAAVGGEAARKSEGQAVVEAPSKAATSDASVAAVASQQGTIVPTKDASEERKTTSTALGTAIAVVLLVGLGVSAMLLARRRVTRDRMIRIVETASIGSRRSLVVACVGGRTMVLGVSEAGVSLLDTQSVAPTTSTVPDPQAQGPAEDAALGLRNLAFAAGFAQDGTPEAAKHEGSILSRLFHRKRRAPGRFEREDFDQLFAESLEDEDLRRKLALGESGRVA